MKVVEKGSVEMYNKISDNMPQILKTLGFGMIITGTVGACVATSKVQNAFEKFNEAREDIDNIKEEYMDTELAMDEKTYKKELVKLYFELGGNIAKYYALPIALEVGGIACYNKSFSMIETRYTDAVAALTSYMAILKNYRKNVVDKYGKDVDLAMRYGLDLEQETVEEIDPETGKKKKVKKDVLVLNEGNNNPFDGYSEYSRIFGSDEYYAANNINDYYQTSEYENNQALYNKSFLLTQEREINKLLRIKKRIYLFEVYDMLGFDRTDASMEVGWIYDPEGGDEQISFGVTEFRNKRAFNGYEVNFILDFNVDGHLKGRAGQAAV